MQAQVNFYGREGRTVATLGPVVVRNTTIWRVLTLRDENSGSTFDANIFFDGVADAMTFQVVADNRIDDGSRPLAETRSALPDEIGSPLSQDEARLQGKPRVAQAYFNPSGGEQP